MLLNKISGRSLSPKTRGNKVGAVSQRTLHMRSTSMHSFDKARTCWRRCSFPKRPGLARGSIITAVSWNIDVFADHHKARARHIIKCIKGELTKTPTKTVVMFQGVCRQSLHAILASRWVQEHFNLSNAISFDTPSNDVYWLDPIVEEAYGSAEKGCTFMLISKDLPLVSMSRVPLVSPEARDVLAVDLAVGGCDSPETRQRILRLCTTELESRGHKSALRSDQLAFVSTLLRGESATGYTISAGLIGLDTSTSHVLERESSRATGLQLQDAWKNGPSQLPVPDLAPFEKDPENGLWVCNTWGYQSGPYSTRTGTRRERFLTTGAIDYVPLEGGDQLTRGMRRLGVGKEIRVKAFEYLKKRLRGPKRTMESPDPVSLDMLHELRENLEPNEVIDMKDVVESHLDVWLSAHYGIMAKFRVM